MNQDFIYLASGSPRRRELLDQIGVRYRVIVPGIDESLKAGETPSDYVVRLAGEKAGAVAVPDDAPAAVLAADTTVVLNGEILGKPGTAGEGADMLGALAGRTHTVFTGVAVRSGDSVSVACSESDVTLGPVSPAQLAAYWDTGEPCDKAGAYAVQGLGAVFVREIRGSFSGVMGLPLYETASLLQAAGVALPLGAAALEGA